MELQKGKVNDTVNVFETYSLSSLTKRIYFTAVTMIRNEQRVRLDTNTLRLCMRNAYAQAHVQGICIRICRELANSHAYTYANACAYARAYNHT